MEISPKHIEKIVSLQHIDGSWGVFHSLGFPTPQNPLSTEKALRRLRELGLTKNDEPIKKALAYIRAVLNNTRSLPDRREKVINWDFFEEMMLAAWLKIFLPQDAQAAKTAAFWGELITLSCTSGRFSEQDYFAEYRRRVPKLNPNERPISVCQFYMAHLLGGGVLDSETEKIFLAYVINNSGGIYYVYDRTLSVLPQSFESPAASRYLAALDCLSGYRRAGGLLAHTTDWIYRNKGEKGWDFGKEARDGVYLPLSGSWRNENDRIADCTLRVKRILDRITQSASNPV